MDCKVITFVGFLDKHSTGLGTLVALIAVCIAVSIIERPRK